MKSFWFASTAVPALRRRRVVRERHGRRLVVHVDVHSAVAARVDRYAVRNRLERVAADRVADGDDRVSGRARRRAARRIGGRTTPSRPASCCSRRPLGLRTPRSRRRRQQLRRSRRDDNRSSCFRHPSLPFPSMWLGRYYGYPLDGRRIPSKSRGFRRMRRGRRRYAFPARSCRGSVRTRSRPSRISCSSTPPELAGELGVDGDTERDGLPVHGSAGRDDEIGGRDEALGVDRALGNDRRRQGERADVRSLLVRARKDDGVNVVAATQQLERPREERVAAAVIERDIRRWAEHDEDAAGADSERARDIRVGLEVGEVVLLLQAGIAGELRRLEAVTREALGGDRLGDDDARGRSRAELVLGERVLVVEGRRRTDAEPAGREREVVRAMRQRGVEAPRLRPPAQLPEPGRHCPGLAEP